MLKMVKLKAYKGVEVVLHNVGPDDDEETNNMDRGVLILMQVISLKREHSGL